MRLVPRFLTAVATASVAILLPGCAADNPRLAAPDPAWQAPFFFLQLTDPQFGMFAENKDFARETELFGQAIAIANRLHPAFVIVTGDLVNKTGDPAQIAEFQRLARGLAPSIPLYLVAGNHDVGNVPTPATLKTYRQHFGPDWYAFDHAGCHFIVLDTSIIWDPSKSGDEMDRQLAWLKEDLRGAAGREYRHIIAFLHHPLFLKSPAEEDSYHVIPLARRGVYLDLFRQYQVHAAFAGHLHRDNLAKVDGLEMIATGPVGKPLGKEPPGFRVVKVYADRIEHQYVPLDPAPQHVRLDEAKVN